MRQAGILAAAGMYALQNNINRLEEDHTNAQLLAEGLTQHQQLKVSYQKAQTNMVFFRTEPENAKKMSDYLLQHQILVTPGTQTRLVTHLDVSRDDINFVLGRVAEFFSK